MTQKYYQIGSYEKAFPEGTTLQDMLDLSADAGYDFFEISIDRTDGRISRLYDKDFQRELSNILFNSKIKIGSICLSALGTYTLGNPNKNNQAKAIDIFKHAILFAEKFGIRIIQVPACDVPKFDTRTPESDAAFFNNLKELIPLAAEHSIMIGLENMENDYMDSVKKCMRLVEELNSPYFQMYPDAGNITSAALLTNSSIEDDMQSAAGHYAAFHQKETRPNKYGGLFYGEGHVDFQKCTDIAWSLGARRFVMEYWYIGNPEWKADLKKVHDLCVEWISNAARN